MNVPPGFGRGDPAAGAIRGRDPGVDCHPGLEGDERPVQAGGRQPDAIDVLRSRINFARRDHLEPGRPQRMAAAGRRGPRVINGDDHLADTGSDQCCGTWSGAAGVVAGFQGDDGGAATRCAAGFGQRKNLGVRATRLCMKALAHHFACGGEHDTTDNRIGQHRPVALGGEFDSTAQSPGLGRRQGGGGHVHQCARVTRTSVTGARTCAHRSSSLGALHSVELEGPLRHAEPEAVDLAGGVQPRRPR